MPKRIWLTVSCRSRAMRSRLCTAASSALWRARPARTRSLPQTCRGASTPWAKGTWRMPRSPGARWAECTCVKMRCSTNERSLPANA